MNVAVSTFTTIYHLSSYWLQGKYKDSAGWTAKTGQKSEEMAKPENAVSSGPGSEDDEQARGSGHHPEACKEYPIHGVSGIRAVEAGILIGNLVRSDKVTSLTNHVDMHTWSVFVERKVGVSVEDAVQIWYPRWKREFWGCASPGDADAILTNDVDMQIWYPRGGGSSGKAPGMIVAKGRSFHPSD
jgi:hypothetical protein